MIRGQSRGHNDMTFWRPSGVGCPQGIFGGLSYYQLVILFFNIVPLIMEFTMNDGVGDAVMDMGKLETGDDG